tara:strand:+ start:273 stop:632 length:360 start_codon:yes stop_codon:yes gene_type:complete
MALGNANSSAQARGKNKATKIRKRKEVDAAAGFTEIQATSVHGGNACSDSTLNVRYFHDDSHPSGLPLTAGTKVYTKKRVNSDYYAANGHIKVGPDRGRYYNIQITSGEVKAPGGAACP